MSGRLRERAVALIVAAVPFWKGSVLLALFASFIFAACTTRSLGTTRTPAAPLTADANGITGHGFVDGELVLHFTPDGERAVAPAVGRATGPLRFGVPSLDRLNAKYRATSLAPLAGEAGAYVLKLSPDANVMRAADEYGREPLIARAEPNFLFRIHRPAEAPGAVRTEVKP